MLTVADAAARARRDPETIRRWIRAGRLAAWKVGGQHMIDEAALAEAIRPMPSVLSARVRDTVVEEDAGGARSRSGHGVGEAAVAYGSGGTPSIPTGFDAPDSLDPLLTQIVGVIVRDFDPARIVLFGERASGARRPDAEYKFVVVLDQVERRWEKAAEIRMAFSELPVFAEVVVAPAAEVEGRVEGPAIDHTFWPLREGVTLYERA